LNEQTRREQYDLLRSLNDAAQHLMQVTNMEHLSDEQFKIYWDAVKAIVSVNYNLARELDTTSKKGA